MRNFQDVNQPIKTNADSAQFDVNGQFSSAIVEVVGTFTGYLEVKGITTGLTQPTLYIEDVNGGIQASSNRITAQGMYRCAPAALQAIRVVPHSSFASTAGIVVNFSGSESLPPISIAGYS